MGYVNQYGLSRKHIFHAVEKSLERLGADYIDLYQIHRFDPNTPVAETMEALHDLVKSGKVRYIGASSMYAHQLLEMQYTARMRGWTEFASMQNLYNPIYREEEKEMYPACAKFGMAGIPWSPLAMGYCARPLADMQSTDRGRKMLKDGLMGKPFTEQDESINIKIGEIAKERKVSMATVALAWVRSKPFIHSPILGMNSIDRVKEMVAALDFELTKEEIDSINGLYKNAKNILAI